MTAPAEYRSITGQTATRLSGVTFCVSGAPDARVRCSPLSSPKAPVGLRVPAESAGSEITPKPAERKASGELHRGTYSGVVDTGPVPGETHEQKIARLTKLAAAAKQKAEEGGAS